MRVSRILLDKPKGCMTLVSDVSVGEYPTISSLILFYSRFAGLPTKILVIGSEGTEVIDSREVIDVIRGKARSISASLRSMSLRFERHREIPSGFEVFPRFGEQYALVHPEEGKEGEQVHEPGFANSTDPELIRQQPSSISSSPHLEVRVLPTQRSYLVHYAAEEFFRATLDISFFARGFISTEFLGRGKFDDFLRYREELAGHYLEYVVRGLPNGVRESILAHSVFRSVGLSKLYPLYADPSVQEVYLDAVGLRAYVDHASFGRLRTNIRLNLSDVESLVVNLRRNTGLRLDLKVPSIKGDLVTRHCISRVSIDSHPLVMGGYALDIRKLRPAPFCLVELVNKNFITLEAASLLLSFLLCRMNISIIGEPGSGKTTLLASLDALAPSWWRKVYLEDCREVFQGSEPEKSQSLHLIVDPFESRGAYRKKSSEIIKLLHRNPSYVILGEVQFSDHFKALFHAMAAGIRVMHTAHASAVPDFIRRVTRVYRIPVDLVSNLDLIAFLRKEEHELGTSRAVDSLTVACESDGSEFPRLVSVESNPSRSHSRPEDVEVLIGEIEGKRGPQQVGVSEAFEEIMRTMGRMCMEREYDLATVQKRVTDTIPSVVVG